jgi:3-hydroxyisobutyrate dehydrogenase-like beta-hydroxyacid dehydrogenase
MNNHNKPTVGWIGLGKMGAPMAANLQMEGFEDRKSVV